MPYATEARSSKGETIMIRRISIFVVLILCTSSSSFGQSERGKYVGKETVGEWRRTAERAHWYETGYAQGALVVVNPMFDCPNSMGAVVLSFFAERGCTLRDEIRQTIIRQERRLE
jgi:hypothetical protein